MQVPANYEELQLQAEADIMRLCAQKVQIESEIANVRLRVHQERLRMCAQKLEHHKSIEAKVVRHLNEQPAYGTASANAAGRPRKAVSKKSAPVDHPGAKPKRVMTPAGRKAISEAQKRRWAAKRAEKGGKK